MGFKQGDRVTVVNREHGVYDGIISDGDEGVVVVEGNPDEVIAGTAVYGVEFFGVSGMLLLYAHELALIEDPQPPTSLEGVNGD